MPGSDSQRQTIHDMRTALTIINGHAEMLQTGFDGELPPDAKAAVTKIQKAGKDLGVLIDSLST